MQMKMRKIVFTAALVLLFFTAAVVNGMKSKLLLLVTNIMCIYITYIITYIHIYYTYIISYTYIILILYYKSLFLVFMPNFVLKCDVTKFICIFQVGEIGLPVRGLAVGSRRGPEQTILGKYRHGSAMLVAAQVCTKPSSRRRTQEYFVKNFI